jgi:predicted transposase YdaD
VRIREGSPACTSVVSPGEPFDAALRYRVLRVWEVPAAAWLSGGLGLVPLAPLGSVQKADLPAVVARMKQRIDREAPNQAKELWSAAYILMGFRYEQALIQTLLRGVKNMKESVTYQAILEEGKAEGEAKGKAEGARKLLLLMGRDRLGEPSTKVMARLDALTDLGQLEALGLRLLHVNTWEELLGANGTKRHSRGRR